MTNQELSRISDTYRTMKHLVLGHIYRDVMSLLEYVLSLKEEIKQLKEELGR